MPKTKAMCQGCKNDYYNQNRKGGCWSFARAKVVTRVSVGTWQQPPYRWRPQKVLSCMYSPGTHWLEQDDPRVVDDTDEAVSRWQERVAADQAAFREREAKRKLAAELNRRVVEDTDLAIAACQPTENL